MDNIFYFKFFKFLLFFFLSLGCSIFAQGGWQWQKPYPQGNALKSISFVATVANDGWAVGDLGTVVFTPDGGTTWENIDIGTTENLNSVYMRDDNMIFIVGDNGTIYFLYYDGTSLDITKQISNTTENLNSVNSNTNGCTWIAGDNRTILRTTDLGVTWNKQNVIYPFDLNSIHNIECTTAWAVGNDGFIMHTTDWGINWTFQSAPTNNYLFAVDIGTFNHIRAVGNSGTMLLSTDEGGTWTIEDCGTTAHLYDVLNIGYARAYAVGAQGTILETTDTGEPWVQRNSNTTATLYDIEDQYGTDDMWVAGHYGMVLKNSGIGTDFELKTGETRFWITGVEFIDNNIGWAVGGEHGVEAKDGIFMKTTDAGLTWIELSTHDQLNAVDFVNENKGWAVGEDGKIRYTINSGDSWGTQTSPVTADLNALCFIDENNGWAVGDLGEIIHTTNGGSNWVRQNSTTPNWLYGVYFVNENKGWAVGLDSTIVHTTDGGQNWERQIIGASNGFRFTSVYFEDEMHGWVVGIYGSIFLTIDGSETWQEIESGTDKSLESVYFVDKTHGWIVGDAGTILHTTDGGFTWNHQFSGVATNYLVSVYFTDRENGWVVGEGGTILHTNDGGGPVTNVKDEEINKPQTFLLSQNYPNPFNPSTKIKYSIPNTSSPLLGGARGGLVTLKIYDVLGREVAILINESKQPGEYEVEFNTNNLPTGVYFYRIQVGNFIDIKKMILLK